MIGVGTTNVDISKGSLSYQSFLGLDSESYGYSFKGKKQHDGKMDVYGLPFQRGSIIGVHLDMWNGTIEFYLNRQPLGVYLLFFLNTNFITIVDKMKNHK